MTEKEFLERMLSLTEAIRELAKEGGYSGCRFIRGDIVRLCEEAIEKGIANTMLYGDER